MGIGDRPLRFPPPPQDGLREQPVRPLRSRVAELAEPEFDAARPLGPLWA
jgi:hypothetical protein